jgi:hypothetical protein
MSVVTEHLEQRGSAFEVLPHRQAYTSTDEARALGIDAGDVLKTLAVRTGPGYALVVIPASRRLDLHLVRDALGDHHARLASEEELGRDFAAYQLARCRRWGRCSAASRTSIRRCWRTTPWCSRPAARPSRSGWGPGRCSAASRSGPCRWSSRRTGAATTRSVAGGRRSRTWQAAGTQRRNAFPTGDALTDPSGLLPEVASSKVSVGAHFPVSNGPASGLLASLLTVRSDLRKRRSALGDPSATRAARVPVRRHPDRT